MARLRMPAPPDRTETQLINHFRRERDLARRLREAARSERARLYKTVYDELFADVPDHPRLTRRNDQNRTDALNKIKMRLVAPFLDPGHTVAEFGCGDGRFAVSLCDHVRRVIGLDISDQRGPDAASPDNFELRVYDGYDLPLEPDSVDLAFSDQLIEHFHPDDTILHFRTVWNILKPGGTYVLRTPNALSGPHDISMYFSDTPLGFHLKEWNHREMLHLLGDTGFVQPRCFRFVKGRLVAAPRALVTLAENTLDVMPGRLRRMTAGRIVPEVILAAQKPAG